ncbi:MAG: hypothetical protein ACQEQ0_05220 [Bacteroidota bacterium]
MSWTKNILFAMLLLSITSTGAAQKGTGNQSGVARSNAAGDVENLSGSIQKIITEPCASTTGRYSTGTHMLIKTGDEKKNTINVHLGPAKMVSDMTDQLSVDQSIELFVFRTQDLPEDHYIVKEFSSEGKTFELRDVNLRPFWANSKN